MKKAVKAILNVLSYGGIEVESARRLADIKKLDPIRIFLRKLDMEIYNGDYKVPIRLFFPDEKMEEHGAKEAILFFHGGGWTTESVETYDRVCARMAQSTGQIVVSVEYRLAPEHRFPTGLEDCYAAAQAMLRGEILPEVTPENVTIMGDSAGGNLAAAVFLMARDKKELLPGKQILIYPAVNSCYTEKSPYKSVKTNGTGYLLTSVKMEDYVILYQRTEEDRKNPYFAPVLAENLQGLPDTLVLTAQYDPLRDEGEDYAKKLKRAGNLVEHHRIKGALHGYFALGIEHLYVQESFQYMNAFLRKEKQQKNADEELENIAAVKLLREYLPEVKVRFINVVDLMKLQPNTRHPHGLTGEEYNKLFTKDKPIIFNYHGYPTLIHEFTYERENKNVSVHGYMEEGTITTPFDMRVKNEIDRYHIVIDVIKHLDIYKTKKGKEIIKIMEEKLKYHDEYIKEYGIETEEVRNFRWE